jgi:23S rRNA (guanosine2251-2'-O)-methyltransferase
VVYGIHAVTELLATRPEQIGHIYFEADVRSGQLFELLKQCRKLRLPYTHVPRTKLFEVAGCDKHQGVVASCNVKSYADMDEVEQRISASASPLLLVPASIEDPRNLGALARTATAFGVDAILLERRNTAPLTASVAKASAGMIEHVLIARPRSLEGAVKEYRERGFAVVGAEAGEYPHPSQVDFAGPTVIVLGGENRGIPPYLLKLCTSCTSIPLPAHVPSLNVSVAGAILLYECSVQRRGSRPDSASRSLPG